MEQEKYLFDPAMGNDVIQNYSLYVFKLLIEDKEWSETIIMSLDANDFSLYEFRNLIGSLQDYYVKHNVIPDYDILLNEMFIFHEYSDIDKELYVEYCNRCKEIELNPFEIKQIKTSLPYWSSYVLIARIGNMCLDNARNGYKTEHSFEVVANKVISMADKLKMLADNPNIPPHTYEGWV